MGINPAPSSASLFVHLLPYVEQQAAFQSFDMKSSAITGANSYYGHCRSNPPYLCPAGPSMLKSWTLSRYPGRRYRDVGVGKTNYCGNIAHTVGRSKRAAPTSNRRIPLACLLPALSESELLQITDGTSNTVMFAEIKRCDESGERRTRGLLGPLHPVGYGESE